MQSEPRESGRSVKYGLYGGRGNQIGIDFCLKFLDGCVVLCGADVLEESQFMKRSKLMQ